MPVVLQRRQARRDILESFDYLEERSGLEMAERFLASTLETFQELAGMPKMGRLCEFEHPSLKRMRRWPVKDFENWLIFYLPKRNGVEILRVLHGARDLEALFG